MVTHFGFALKDYLLNLGLGKSEWFAGCSDQEINEIRLAQEVEFLPEVYRQFLSVMGHFAGGVLLRGSDYGYKDLLTHKEWAKGFAEEMSGIDLPSDAFVFYSHQGYEFCYFLTQSREEDPPIFRYFEGDSSISRVSNHFSAWVYGFIDDIRGIK